VKKLYLALAILIVILQARLLSSEGGLGELFSLQEQLKTQEHALEQQRLLNIKLAEEVKSLQTNPQSIETLARQTLGMVKEDEVFIQVIELKSEQPAVLEDGLNDNEGSISESNQTSQ
jgi:cell division protein FtsB